jgi:hypothetical protein
VLLRQSRDAGLTSGALPKTLWTVTVLAVGAVAIIALAIVSP